MFHGKLGTCNTTLVDLKFKGDVKPVCLWPYPITRVRKVICKNNSREKSSWYLCSMQITPNGESQIPPIQSQKIIV